MFLGHLLDEAEHVTVFGISEDEVEVEPILNSNTNDNNATNDVTIY